MANNENENQRKRWLMIKKADKSIIQSFNKSIIPIFSDDDKITKTKFQHIDTFGTWTLTASIAGQSGSYQNVDKAFNKAESTFWNLGIQEEYQWGLLELPAGLSIAPKKLQISGMAIHQNSFLEGYDSLKNEWITITTLQGEKGGFSKEVEIPEEKQVYCTKFRFNLISAIQYSSAKTMYAKILDIIEGNYKIAQ